MLGWSLDTLGVWLFLTAAGYGLDRVNTISALPVMREYSRIVSNDRAAFNDRVNQDLNRGRAANRISEKYLAKAYQLRDKLQTLLMQVPVEAEAPIKLTLGAANGKEFRSVSDIDTYMRATLGTVLPAYKKHLTFVKGVYQAATTFSANLTIGDVNAYSDYSIMIVKKGLN